MLSTISEHLNNLGEIAFVVIYTLVCIFTSVSFWVSNPSLKGLQRLLVSGHGIATLCLIGIPFTLFALGINISFFLPVFNVCCFLPLLSIVYSFFQHKGTKLLFILYLFLLPAIMWAWFIGGMAVSGDWL